MDEICPELSNPASGPPIPDDPRFYEVLRVAFGDEIIICDDNHNVIPSTVIAEDNP